MARTDDLAGAREPAGTEEQIRRAGEIQREPYGLHNFRAQARIADRIDRLAARNPGDVKPVGEGVSELRINCEPGYRFYFVRDGSFMFFSVVVRRVLRTKTFD